MGAEGVEWVSNATSPTLTRYHGASGANTLYSPTSQAVATAYFDALAPWGIMGRLSLRPDGSVTSRCNIGTTTLQTGDNCYSDTDQTGGEQKMVYIPQFCYYCDTLTPNQVWWWVGQVGDTFRLSDNSNDYTFSASDIHPAFIRNSVTKTGIYISAYEGYVESSTAPYTMQSVAGVQPTTEYNTNLAPISLHATLPNCRTWAKNVGTGWGLQDFLIQRAVCLLIFVEYGSFNIYSVLSPGITGQAGGTNNASGYTGHTTSLGNASGDVSFTMEQQGTTAHAMSYRGIENFYGNVTKWVDGIQIKADYGVWIADNNYATATDNTFTTPYVNTTLSIPSSGTYYLTVASTYGWGFIPATMGGSASTYLCSNYAVATGNRVAYTNSYWTTGAGGGPLALAFDYNTTTGYDKRRGARLEYIPL